MSKTMEAGTLALVGMLITLSGCGGGIYTHDNDGGKAAPIVAQSGDVQIIGRTIALDPNNPAHVRFSWPGVAVGATFSGTSISAVLRDYNDTFNGQSVDSFYDVVVDGNATQTFSITTDSRPYILASNLAPGQHTVWLTKRTEAMLGSTEFSGMTPGPGGQMLAPPPAPSRHIEVIGASIETGYGALQDNCNGYQDNVQSQDVAWPQLTANALGAQLHNTSYSGKGLVNNIDPATDPYNQLPFITNLADPMDFQTQWDFSSWTADVVLLDIGGNDWDGLGGPPDANTFEAAYVKFVQQIVTHYPKAQVYVTMNATDPLPQRQGLIPDLQAVVTQLQQQGVTQAHFFAFPEYTGSVYGCDTHPDAALHQVMANEIVAQLKTDLGW